MKKSKVLNRAWILSVISLLLCCSMLVGTTYAWFTDGVTSGRNKIVAGNLDVDVDYASVAFTDGTTGTSTGGPISWNPVDSTESLFSIESWEPNYTEVVYLKITNNGTLALKYKLSMEIIAETSGTRLNADGVEELFKLSDYLVFGELYGHTEPTTYTNCNDAQNAVKIKSEPLSRPYTDSHVLKPRETDYITLIVYLPEGAGKDVNYTGTDAPTINLDITLEAKQTPDESESDSFDNQYDADATYPIEKVYKIYSPDGKINNISGFWNAIKGSVSPSSSTISDDDIKEIVFGWWNDFDVKVGKAYSEGGSLPVEKVSTDSTSAEEISTELESPEYPIKVFFVNGTLYILTEERDARLSCSVEMESMFRRFKNLERVVLRGLDTSNVTSMANAFYGSPIKEIDLWGLDLSNVTTMSYAFYGCSSLTSIDFSGMDMTSISTMERMFSGCSKLKEVDLSDVNAPKLTNVNNMFFKCSSLEKVDMSGMNVPGLTSMNSLFLGCTALKDVDLSDINTSSVTDIGLMFSGCSQLENVNLSTFDGSSLNNMSQLFKGCDALATVTLPTIQSGTSLSLSEMFRGCANLTEVNLEPLSGAVVTNIEQMFNGCSKLTSLTFPKKFDTSQVTSFSSLFYHCGSLQTIDISSFSNESAREYSKSADNMFAACYGLTTIYASEGFYYDNLVEPNKSVFTNCSNLVGGQGTTYKGRDGSSEFARIDDPENDKPGYFTDVSKKPVDSPAP